MSCTLDNWPEIKLTVRNYAVVWIDHLAAKVFYVGLTGVDEVVLHSHLPSQHLHHKANVIGSGKIEDDVKFLDRVAEALSQSGQILVVGPGIEKVALKRYLDRHHGEIASRVVQVESADHPTDHQIVALAKRHFGFGVRRSNLA